MIPTRPTGSTHARRTDWQVVWFKRDLRICDHAPLIEALQQGPVLGLYLYETELLQSPEWDASHSRFIAEALRELETEWTRRGGCLLLRRGEAVEQLERLHRETGFLRLWSHEETGNRLTFDRDLRVARWCRNRGIDWQERRQDGVVRRLRTRDGWAERWAKSMSGRIESSPEVLGSGRPTGLVSDGVLGPEQLGLGPVIPIELQRGGETAAREVLGSFLEERGVGYRAEMSSPLTAWSGCSRISAHLAWGCVSMRTVHQAALQRSEELRWRCTAGEPVDRRWWGALSSFQSRLRWHCHFMQKLEDEPRIEFENFNPVYDGLREAFTESEEGQLRLEAWRQGRIGFPMVDACMRAVRATGWLNFRMRALVMSVASYHLWLHWRPTSIHLARCFLDFEPGIHFSQAQMQSGTTGINTVRIYSPTLQAIEQDPKGVFIRRWVPELAGVPNVFLAEPWRMTRSQQEASGCVIGVDYPAPRVDPRRSVIEAKERIARVRSSVAAREASRRVYLRHGSRKGHTFRGAEAEARYRQGLLSEAQGPGAEPEQGPVQQELFG
ncbi:MAG: deoxyribodipyrimidine photo-lyase [Verrucomicrobia bacterium]|nr:deoxyribodipyrimidine photo-lyase [Verrucomicrobiota bacterium]